MKTLWNYIEDKNWRAMTKYKTVLMIMAAVSGLAGFVLWLLVRLFFLSTLDWMLCFIGVPAVISWFWGILYSCRNEFHDGSPRQPQKKNAYSSKRSQQLTFPS